MADVTLPGTVHVVDDVSSAFANLVADEVNRSIALSGGETAEACYLRLRDAAVDWPAVEVFFGDERFVPVDHPDSNEGLSRRTLLDFVPVRAIHSWARCAFRNSLKSDARESARKTSPIKSNTEPATFIFILG